MQDQIIEANDVRRNGGRYVALISVVSANLTVL